MYGAPAMTINSKGSEFSGFFFGGKFLTGTDRCGKCSNELVTLNLTKRNTIQVKIVRPNIPDLQSMGDKVYDTILQEGTVPPQSYGGKLTKISSDDETSDIIEGDLLIYKNYNSNLSTSITFQLFWLVG